MSGPIFSRADAAILGIGGLIALACFLFIAHIIFRPRK